MNHNATARPFWLASILLALSMSLVGSYVALSKPLTAALPVLLLAWLRFLLGALAIPHWLLRPTSTAPLPRQTRQLVFLASFLGNFLFTLCMLFGVRLTSAASAGVIMAAIPAVVALLGRIFLNEPIKVRVTLAIGLSILGIGLFSMSKATVPSTETRSHQVWLGNLLVLAAVLCEAAYVVIGKKLSSTMSPKRITAQINLWGLALTTPLGIYAAWGFNFAAVAAPIWLLLLFYALAASVWSVRLWMTGLKTIPAAQAGVFTVMLPITAAAIGVLALDETLNLRQLLAFGLCLMGVLLATLPDQHATKTTVTPRSKPRMPEQ